MEGIEEQNEIQKEIRNEKELQNNLIIYFLKNANDILNGYHNEYISERIDKIEKSGRFSKYYG